MSIRLTDQKGYINDCGQRVSKDLGALTDVAVDIMYRHYLSGCDISDLEIVMQDFGTHLRNKFKDRIEDRKPGPVFADGDV